MYKFKSMIKNKKILKISILFSLICIFSTINIFAYFTNSDRIEHINKPDGNDIESLEEEKNQIELTMEENRRLYDEQVKLYSKGEQELAKLQYSISTQVQEIEKTQVSINEKIKEVNNKKAEVDAAQVKVDSQTVSLRKRLRTMYKFKKNGYLQIILKSDSLVNAMTKIDRIKILAEYDRNLLLELKLLKEKLEIMQKDLELEQKGLEDLKEEQINQKEELEKSYRQETAKKKLIYENMEVLQRQKEQLETESNKITQALKQMKLKREYVGGSMAWPLDLGNNYITSYFGPRQAPTAGASNNHGALDIAAPTGSNIYSPLDGVVIASHFSYAYGEMVMVDHGGGIVTLYAHASQRLVSTDENVSAGDVIAKVGSTGISTGPHLHFEVRVNGVRQNPLNYVNQP